MGLVRQTASRLPACKSAFERPAQLLRFGLFLHKSGDNGPTYNAFDMLGGPFIVDGQSHGKERRKGFERLSGYVVESAADDLGT